MAKIQFWLTFNNGKEKLQLPVNPSSVNMSSPFGYSEVNVAQLGEITLVGDTMLRSITLSSFFPNYYAPNYCEYTNIPKPWSAIQMLERWRASRQPCRLIITGTPINMAVSIRDLTYDAERLGSNGDIYFDLSLKEFKFVQVRTINLNTVNKTAPVKKPAAVRPNTTVKPRTHTVKKNESLWTIAKKYYGNSDLWKKIYEANKSKIGKNPHLIYLNMVLTIPK